VAPAVKPKLVVFACVHNAGRSQMAAAFFNRRADPQRARAISAGTAPAARVHPEVVAAMQEAGIDLAAARPAQLTAELVRSADLLVTMGCGEACPAAPPSVERRDWEIADPKGQGVARVREIRDDIRARVAALVGEWR
jgi:arsenate reductase (thioredoxin)